MASLPAALVTHQAPRRPGVSRRGTLRQLGYGGQAVAAVMGLTVNYVATLHNRALREGTGRAGRGGEPSPITGG